VGDRLASERRRRIKNALLKNMDTNKGELRGDTEHVREAQDDYAQRNN